MTNREICERLLNIHNRLFVEYSLADGLDDFDLDGIGKDISSLLLDLAAPVDHFADLGKKGAALPDGTPINLCGEDK